MKNKRKSFSLFAAALLCVLLTAMLITGFYKKNYPTKAENSDVSGLNTPKIESDEFEGDVEKRRDWFMKQRLYGLGEIPVEARKRAKETSDLLAPPLLENSPLVSTWSLIGPQPTRSLIDTSAFGDSSGRINAIAIHPNTPNTVLLGTATGGVWRSTNALADVNGATPPVFTPVSDSQVDLAVGSIAFAPSDPTVVYAGMGDIDNNYLGTGILKSTDTGATWARVNTNGIPARGTTSQVAVSLNNPNTVFAARAEFFQPSRGMQVDGGFYRSIDGGVNWTQTFAGNVTSIAQHPTNASVIYISVVNSQISPMANGVYMSTDGGQSFAAINGAVNFSSYSALLVATTAANPQKIFAYGGTEGNVFVLGAVNDGVNPVAWTVNSLALSQIDSGQFTYNIYLSADPFTDGRLYVGSRDVFRITLNSDNTFANVQDLTNSWAFDGTKWDYTLNGAKAHSDQQSFSIAGNANSFFIGSDGGINRSTDGGANFTQELNRTLGLTQAVGVTIHPINSNIAYIGTQDNGTERRETGTQWKEFSNGDGGYSVINPLDTSMVFTSYVQGSFSRYSANGTVYEAQINSNFAGMTTNFYPPLVGNGTDSTLYSGAQTLAVCTNCATSSGQGNWIFPAGASDLTRGGGDIINAVAVQRAAFTNTQAVYVGSNTGAFQVSQNGGAAFTNRTSVLDNAVNVVNPGRTITNIKIDPANAGTAYITVSGFGTMHVFKSTNFGANIAPLPFVIDIPVNDFVIDPKTATTFYIATDIGVYISTDSGATWNQFNAGLPPVVVTRFDSAPDGRIAASTYGRGVYLLNAPTAASVSVGGRVMIPTGRGLANAVVKLTKQSGETLMARTNPFGYYHFKEIEAGQTIILSVSSKRYQFAPRVVSLTEAIENLDFTAQQP
ncbi:MAG: hypothetical protein ACR2HG_10825 [Pyrinomonadaceae bacterium]